MSYPHRYVDTMHPRWQDFGMQPYYNMHWSSEREHILSAIQYNKYCIVLYCIFSVVLMIYLEPTISNLNVCAKTTNFAKLLTIFTFWIFIKFQIFADLAMICNYEENNRIWDFDKLDKLVRNGILILAVPSFGKVRHNSRIKSWLSVCKAHYA